MSASTHIARAGRCLDGWTWTHEVLRCSWIEHRWWAGELHRACVLATLEAMQGGR